jgi:hypothetical protein
MESPTKSIFLSDHRKHLFTLTEEFTKHNVINSTNPIRKYNIANHITYDHTIHWVIYDFINRETYAKSIDKMNCAINPLSNIYKTSTGEPGRGVGDVNSMREYIESIQSSTGAMIECEIENKYILAIFDKTYDSANTPSVDAMIGSIIQTYLGRTGIKLVKTTDMANATYNLIPTMNWVWFRKNQTSYLSSHIPSRAASWIKMNPEFTFHLWTNLEDLAEFNDFTQFLSDADKAVMSKITIHYRQELWDLAQEFCESNSVSWVDYKNLLDSPFQYSIVFKTDSIRNIILAMRGGWYSDFNDTYCFVPLKYIVSSEDIHCYFGSCEEDVVNNYLMYTPLAPYNSDWIAKTTLIVNNSSKFVKNMNDNKILDAVIDIITRVVIAFCNTLEKTTQPENMFDILGKILGPFSLEYKTLIGDKLEISNKHHITDIMFVQLFMNAMNNSAKGTAILERINTEFGNIGRVNFSTVKSDQNTNNINKFFQSMNIAPVKFNLGPNANGPITWRQKMTTTFMPTSEDINAFRQISINENEIETIFIKIVVQQIMRMTNMGVVYSADKSSKYRVFPYCSIYSNYTLLSVVAHLEDGTYAGNLWKGIKESYL